MDRRELFSFLSSPITSEKKQNSVVIRPPYFQDEESFSKCVECSGVCATVCPEKIIVISDDKTPRLDFSKRGCSYCDECAKVCEFSVLEEEYKKSIDIDVTISQRSCLSWQGVMCFSCKDPCLENAIDFQAMFMPVINEKCTSCGFCVGVCPANAIELKRKAS